MCAGDDDQQVNYKWLEFIAIPTKQPYLFFSSHEVTGVVKIQHHLITQTHLQKYLETIEMGIPFQRLMFPIR